MVSRTFVTALALTAIVAAPSTMRTDPATKNLISRSVTDESDLHVRATTEAHFLLFDLA